MLDNVRELVGEQAAPLLGFWSVCPRCEDQMGSDGISQSIDAACRPLRAAACVHTHGPKVVAEMRLHEDPGMGVERSPRGSKDLTHNLGSGTVGQPHGVAL